MLGGFRSVNIIELLALQNNRLPVSLKEVVLEVLGSWAGVSSSVRKTLKL